MTEKWRIAALPRAIFAGRKRESGPESRARGGENLVYFFYFFLFLRGNRAARLPHGRVFMDAESRSA
jgi:hypothetical protein